MSGAKKVPELFQCLGYAGVLRITPAACKARQKDANRGRLDYPSTKACLTCERHPKHEKYRQQYKKALETWAAQERRESREDGLCPVCGSRQRHVYNSGRRAVYCTVCIRERTRAVMAFNPMGKRK